MSLWMMSRMRRATAALTLATTIGLTLSACGGGDEPEKSSARSSSSSESQEKTTGRASQQVDDSKVIATLKGTQGIVLDITSATRDSGGFVTVNGNLKNTSDKKFYETQTWTGPELALVRGVGGGSMGGATLVDKAEKKRYYTLRDTENRPLATMGLASVEPNSEQKVFMQFPAPPESTTEVDIQIPSFQSATLTLTDA